MSPLGRLALLVAIVATFFLGFDMFRPEVRPLESPPDSFSAARAAQTIDEIAKAPHPTGHPEGERVRGWLVEALRELGLEVSIQETIVVGNAGLPPGESATLLPAGVTESVRVRNIVARLPGALRQGSEPAGEAGSVASEGVEKDAGADANGARRDAILLAAHTDTRPAAPGAADDSSGVAIILEVIRALRMSESGAPERDVIILLSDAEELGLYGARGFLAEHPLAKEIAVVVNLEARGNRGASRMFETAAGNAEWIEALDRATGPIAADSLSASIYRALPRDTDLTIFRQAGMAGYNFAFIRGTEYYHTPLDRLEFLDLGSVQEQGEAVLALVRTLAEGELPTSGTEDAIYFPFAGELWRLESRTGRALAYASLVLVLGVLVQAVFVRRAVRFGALVRAAVGGGLLIAIAGFFTMIVSRLIYEMFDAGTVHPSRFEANAGSLLLGMLAVGTTLQLSGWASLRNSRLTRAELVAAGLLAWAGVTLALVTWLPDASYLGTFPLIGGACVLLGQSERGSRGTMGVLLALGALPLIALWPRTLDGVGVAFGAGAAPAVVVMIGLILPITAPLLAAVIPAALRRRPVILFPVSVIGLVVIASGPQYDESLPRAGSIHYVYDATNEIALWVSFDESPGEFEKQFLGEKPARESFGLESLKLDPPRAWVRSAASRSLSAPRFEVTELDGPGGQDSRGGEGREDEGDWVMRRIEVRLPEGTARFDLTSESPLSDFAVLDGGEWKRIAKRVTRFRLHAPEETVSLRVRMPRGRAVELRGTAMSYGLPELETWTPDPRTKAEMQSIGDRTYVTTTFEG